MNVEVDIGAIHEGAGRCRFRLWAPFAERVDLHILSPHERLIPMQERDSGYFDLQLKGTEPGSLYCFRLNGERERPDPASRFQPLGVHGPSQVIEQQFGWEDENWKGIPLSDAIFYELHVGTFTPEGTFDAAISRLKELEDLGVNHLEIMPVGQFPGERNWGYDGVQPFAVQNSYGGPEGFKRFVNACHRHRIGVTLDVVYNHLGPEGNYLRDFGPYFTPKYRTPWGEAINFDDAHSDEVRNYFIQNAIYWFQYFHIDALRLDAVHAITDMSALPFLQELAERVEAFSVRNGRKRYLIAESDLNDAKLIRPRPEWGYGLDAQWSDDFHHSLHTLLTGERRGYYADFGKVEQLVRSMREGFVYSGQYSRFRKRRHGNSAADRPAEQFIVASQNHDQVGNRMLGERLSTLISFEAEKVVAGALILAPAVPLLFMGQEYGEEAPFLYFVDHGDADLMAAVRKGRKEEFKDFLCKGEPPDPAGEETFLRSRLNWEKRAEGHHKVLLEFYKTLIRLRREIPALKALSRRRLDVHGLENGKILYVRRWCEGSEVVCLFSFNSKEVSLQAAEISFEGEWQKILDSSHEKWRGPGTSLPEKIRSPEVLVMRPHGLAVYRKIPEES